MSPPMLVENVCTPAQVDNNAGASQSMPVTHVQRRHTYPQVDVKVEVNAGKRASLRHELQRLQNDVQRLREELKTTSSGPERLPASFFELPADACEGEQVLITPLAKSDPEYELLSRHFMASWR